MIRNIVLIGILTSFFVGCSNDEVQTSFGGDFLELTKRYSGNIKTNKVMSISEMSPEDAIVVVNGYPLTKKVFDDLTVIKAKRLSNRKGANPAVVESLVNQFKRQYIPLFVSQRLMLDKARELKVLSVDEVASQVNSDLAGIAKKRKVSVDKIVKAFPGDFKYYLYDAAAEKWLKVLVEKHIPPKLNVDDAFVSNVQKQVELENFVTTQTNELIRVQMESWKKQIISGKLNFDELAKAVSQDVSSDTNCPSLWGEFERGELSDKNVQAKIFALKLGEISDPIEDEDGFHLVKLLKVTPPELNKKGRVIRNEMRKVSHIYIEKMPLLIRQDDPAMFEDLKEQMKMQAIFEYSENLRTNSAYKVVYPHGEDLF